MKKRFFYLRDSEFVKTSSRMRPPNAILWTNTMSHADNTISKTQRPSHSHNQSRYSTATIQFYEMNGLEWKRIKNRAPVTDLRYIEYRSSSVHSTRISFNAHLQSYHNEDATTANYWPQRKRSSIQAYAQFYADAFVGRAEVAQQIS